MHLRRALLLFALVLGLTAVAASIAPPPPSERGGEVEPPPPPPPDAGEEPVELRFRPPAAGARPKSRRVEPGVPLSVEVAVREPGEVAIPRLGRSDYATPLAPARFDLLAPQPGRYEVTFAPLDAPPEPLGVIVSAD